MMHLDVFSIVGIQYYDAPRYLENNSMMLEHCDASQYSDQDTMMHLPLLLQRCTQFCGASQFQELNRHFLRPQHIQCAYFLHYSHYSGPLPSLLLAPSNPPHHPPRTYRQWLGHLGKLVARQQTQALLIWGIAHRCPMPPPANLQIA